MNQKIGSMETISRHWLANSEDAPVCGATFGGGVARWIFDFRR